MIAYNFSKAQKREKRIYGFSDWSFSESGISTRLILIEAITVAISLTICIIIGNIIGNQFINPFINNTTMDFTGLFFALGIPTLITAGLYFIKIQHYRLYEFIFLWLLPKKTIDLAGKSPVQDKVSIDAFLWYER